MKNLLFVLMAVFFMGQSFATAEPKSKSPSNACDNSLSEAPPLTEAQIAEELKARENLMAQMKLRLADVGSSGELLSRLNYHALQPIYESKRGVAFLLSDIEVERNRDEIIEAIKRAVKKNSFIIYDADTSFADDIRKIAKEKAVGITSKIEKQNYDQNVFCIPSVYFRLRAFRSARKVFVTRSSTVGIAVLVDGGADAILDDQERQYELTNWQYDNLLFDRNLNLKFKPVLNSVDADVLLEKYKKFREELPKLLPPLSTADIHSEDLQDLLHNHDFMLQQDQLMEGFGGAVIFGSALYDKQSIPKNYEIAYFLSSKGIPVTTGGAGGAMKVANTGAYDAGGVSIGIPIEGRNQLRLETKVSSKVQTKTVSTLNHGERIPLLMNHKELVIAVPGGSGTMQELAVTLMKMQAEPNSSFQLILLDKVYYSGFYQWIRNQNLSENIISRIHLVDDSNEFKILFEKLLSDNKIDSTRLYTQERPEGPRNRRTSFKPRMIAIEEFFDNLFKKIFGSKK